MLIAMRDFKTDSDATRHFSKCIFLESAHHSLSTKSEIWYFNWPTLVFIACVIISGFSIPGPFRQKAPYLVGWLADSQFLSEFNKWKFTLKLDRNLWWIDARIIVSWFGFSLRNHLFDWLVEPPSRRCWTQSQADVGEAQTDHCFAERLVVICKTITHLATICLPKGTGSVDEGAEHHGPGNSSQQSIHQSLGAERESSLFGWDASDRCGQIGYCVHHSAQQEDEKQCRERVDAATRRHAFLSGGHHLDRLISNCHRFTAASNARAVRVYLNQQSNEWSKNYKLQLVVK